ERLAHAERLAREVRVHDLPAASGRAMEDEHRVPHVAGAVALWYAEGAEVDAEHRQGPTRGETEAREARVALERPGGGRQRDGDGERKESAAQRVLHEGTPAVAGGAEARRRSAARRTGRAGPVRRAPCRAYARRHRRERL